MLFLCRVGALCFCVVLFRCVFFVFALCACVVFVRTQCFRAQRFRVVCSRSVLFGCVMFYVFPPPDRLGLLDFKSSPPGQPHPAYRGRQTPSCPGGPR